MKSTCLRLSVTLLCKWDASMSSLPVLGSTDVKLVRVCFSAFWGLVARLQGMRWVHRGGVKYSGSDAGPEAKAASISDQQKLAIAKALKEHKRSKKHKKEKQKKRSDRAGSKKEMGKAAKTSKSSHKHKSKKAKRKTKTASEDEDEDDSVDSD